MGKAVTVYAANLPEHLWADASVGAAPRGQVSWFPAGTWPLQLLQSPACAGVGWGQHNALTGRAVDLTVQVSRGSHLGDRTWPATGGCAERSSVGTQQVRGWRGLWPALSRPARGSGALDLPAVKIRSFDERSITLFIM